jgi:RNA polymerase sigma-70 factor (ECF subfamily)
LCDIGRSAANNRANTTNIKTLDKAPFIDILENHKGILYKVANSYCKDSEDRQDLIQEITIQLWKSFHKYDTQYKVSTWIYRIALNVSISFYRKERTRKSLTIATDQLVDIQENINDDLEPQILQLNLFIQQLKPLDKALMILYLEDKGHQEISEILGISTSNVATKIGRTKQQLKTQFSKTQTN